jgi:restriction endonuclease S subunit
MKKRTEKQEMKDELRREYDLTKLKGGIRAKYVARYRNGTNLVLLSPEIAKYFPDEQSVNTALRSLIRVAKGSTRRAIK